MIHRKEEEKMKLNLYSVELDLDKHQMMIVEDSFECKKSKLYDAKSIVKVLNQFIRLDRKAEEYVYMLSLSSSCQSLGLFEISH